MTQKCVENESFVRVVTHYGSNESNDSLGVFSEGFMIFNEKLTCSHNTQGAKLSVCWQTDMASYKNVSHVD